MAGIRDPGLIASGFLDPQAQIGGSILGRARSECAAAHQVRQVGTEAPVCSRAADRVAVDAGGGFEDVLTRAGSCVLSSGLLLRLDPSREIAGRVHRDAQQHFGVLRSAILGALAEINSRA